MGKYGYKMVGNGPLIARCRANQDREYNRAYYRDPKPYEPTQQPTPINVTVKIEQPQQSTNVVQPTVSASNKRDSTTNDSLLGILKLCSDFISKNQKKP